MGIDEIISKVATCDTIMIDDMADIAEYLGGDRNVVLGFCVNDAHTVNKVNAYLFALIAKRLWETN